MCGRFGRKTPPHALLKSRNVKRVKNADEILRMMRSFVVVVKNHATDEGILETGSSKWDASCAKLLWEKVGIPYLNVHFGGKHRVAEVAWKTMHNEMVKKKDFV